ncbi:hypothetical protein B0H14DRAFT_3460999 [Mycena olivaceomarginata]|nr:hypothetical protein B0H14DRAFT_3460999 [Mycena olivaceomarginata]
MSATTKPELAWLVCEHASQHYQRKNKRRVAMHDGPQIYVIVPGPHSARLAADARLRRELAAKAKADHRATLRLKRLGQQARRDARATDRASAKAWAAVREALLEPDEGDADAELDGPHGERTPNGGEEEAHAHN